MWCKSWIFYPEKNGIAWYVFAGYIHFSMFLVADGMNSPMSSIRYGFAVPSTRQCALTDAHGFNEAFASQT